jgi:hypothetical protein
MMDFTTSQKHASNIKRYYFVYFLSLSTLDDVHYGKYGALYLSGGRQRKRMEKEK